MLSIKPSQLNLLGAGITLMLMSAVIAPASAERVIVIDRSSPYGVNQSPAIGSFIYGSPIPTPVPVDPSTGLSPSRTVYPNYYPRERHQRFHNSRYRTVYPDYYPRERYHRFHNSRYRTVYPNYYPGVRHRGFYNSITNPVIINNSWRRTPFRGRSRVILINPRKF